MGDCISFWQLLSAYAILIPVIQRDYAQGRTDAVSTRLRGRFVRSLADACRTGRRLHLDFVYGMLEADGVFVPFDGQQRLTTLFLLHLWAAMRAGMPPGAQAGLERFAYQVREDTRMFTQALVCHAAGLPAQGPVSAVLRAQPWFRQVWEADPTIHGMLVMLDEIERACTPPPEAPDRLWNVLTDVQRPPVVFSFALLPPDHGADEIYVKMNARGRQLTGFELFKARFTALTPYDGKFDNEWMDFFWRRYHRVFAAAEKSIGVDACFERFLRALAELLCGYGCAARGELLEEDFDTADLADALSVGVSLPRGQALGAGTLALPNREFLARVLDALAADPDRTDPLLDQCCRGSMSAARLLELLGSLLPLADGTANAPELSLRQRMLRHLVRNSSVARDARWPRQIACAAQLLRHGPQACGDVPFSRRQWAEEQAKLAFRAAACPQAQEALEFLEDHDLLAGRVGLFATSGPDGGLVFDEQSLLDGRRLFSFLHPGSAVDTLVLARALLSVGPYHRRFFANRIHLGKLYDGDAEFSIRHVFAARGGENFAQCSAAVRALGKAVRKCAAPEDAARVLTAKADAFVRQGARAGRHCWRWYFVRYPVMLPGPQDSSIYRVTGGKMFTLLKLRKEKISADHVNPWLLAAVEQAGITGYGGLERGQPLLFRHLRIAMQCEQTRWRVWSWHGGPLPQEVLDVLLDPAAPHASCTGRQAGDLFGRAPAEVCICIPGVDAGAVRMHDAVDRVALVVPLLRALSALQAGASVEHAG